MKKIILSKTSKFKYDKKFKKFVPRWGVLDDISESAIHKKFTLLSSRLETFKYWPCEYFIKGEELAEAGFFYTEKSDIVVCFCCSGELCKFKPFDDDAFKKHAKNFSTCKYINFKKGHEYVNHQRSQDGELKCSICYEQCRDILFHPCLHVCACSGCSLRLSSCPVCRQIIIFEQKIYIT